MAIAGSNPVGSAHTDANGDYSIQLPAGSYSLRTIVVDDFVFGDAVPVTVDAGASLSDIDFVALPTGKIAGKVMAGGT